MNGVMCPTVLTDWWGRCVGVAAGSKGKAEPTPRYLEGQADTFRFYPTGSEAEKGF